MGSEILRRESQDIEPTSTPEVEFALVLSRMIDSVKNDPLHMRETVYELARHKLQEQFTYENVKDIRPLSAALETAIQGVEAFARKNERTVEALRAPEPQQEKQQPFIESRGTELSLGRPMPQVFDVLTTNTVPIIGNRTSLGVPWRFISLLAIALALAIVVRQSGINLDSLRKSAGPSTARQPAPSEPAATAVSEPAAPTISEPPVTKPLVPTTYGIYAVSDDKLYELSSLPGRAPDIRVAISTAITAPSRTMLPDGHVRFIVYQRNSATSAADRAEVRVIARVTRATSFNSAGKPLVSNMEDSWVMRNISIPYKTAPNRDAPEMYEILSENPELALSPGRYALILKGQSFDFAIVGDVTDPKQCLERLAASNGEFYSECQKP